MKIYHYPSATAEKRINAIIDRGLTFRKKDYQAVLRICEDVRQNGDDAVVQYARRFDCPGLSVASLKVSAEELKAARRELTQLRQENEILKKAAAYFAKESL